jgi:hypothetical protein
MVANGGSCCLYTDNLQGCCILLQVSVGVLTAVLLLLQLLMVLTGGLLKHRLCHTTAETTGTGGRHAWVPYICCCSHRGCMTGAIRCLGMRVWLSKVC